VESAKRQNSSSTPPREQAALTRRDPSPSPMTGTLVATSTTPTARPSLSELEQMVSPEIFSYIKQGLTTDRAYMQQLRQNEKQRTLEEVAAAIDEGSDDSAKLGPVKDAVARRLQMNSEELQDEVHLVKVVPANRENSQPTTVSDRREWELSETFSNINRTRRPKKFENNDYMRYVESCKAEENTPFSEILELDIEGSDADRQRLRKHFFIQYGEDRHYLLRAAPDDSNKSILDVFMEAFAIMWPVHHCVVDPKCLSSDFLGSMDNARVEYSLRVAEEALAAALIFKSASGTNTHLPRNEPGVKRGTMSWYKYKDYSDALENNTELEFLDPTNNDYDPAKYPNREKHDKYFIPSCNYWSKLFQHRCRVPKGANRINHHDSLMEKHLFQARDGPLKKIQNGYWSNAWVSETNLTHAHKGVSRGIFLPHCQAHCKVFDKFGEKMRDVPDSKAHISMSEHKGFWKKCYTRDAWTKKGHTSDDYIPRDG